MLATLADPADFERLRRVAPERWVMERKLDGFRALAFRHGSDLHLLSRNRKDLSGKFPEVAQALRRQPLDDFIVDGEVVAISGRDRISFELLQQRLGAVSLDEAKRRGIRLAYFAFDLLRAAGHDLRALPLRERKRLLKQALVFDRVVRYLPHHPLSPRMNLEIAAKRGWEGLMAKEIDAPYISQRTRSWLKLKCLGRQELVVGGWTDPAGSRSDFGALLLGYFDQHGRLMYAGRVGTGFDARLLHDIGAKLRRTEIARCPFEADPELPRKGAHWVTPEMVAEIAFSEWTRDGKLRHPRFLGLRPDKNARDVVRERAVHL